MKKYSKAIWLLIAILITVLVFIFRDKFIGLKGFGLFGLFVISIIGNATIVLPAPVILTAFVGGAIFNPLTVTFVVALGATIGELTGYLAGYGGQEIVGNDAKLQKVEVWMNKNGLWTLFILAAIPNPLFDLAGIVAGATKIPVYKYFIVVFLGKLLKFGVFSYLGANSIGLIDKFL
ncbi:MAG TPA: VTT domain-containing protein [Patescibacteria group bacterium]|nr:VTT domain-containing protein [Patescibacteria group bacterium]